jgi:hypothetical protein
LFYPGGLEDSDDLLNVLTPRPQVKAYVFGHSHAWQRWSWRGIHLLNLPAVAWVFDPAEPHAWVDMKLAATGATLTLRSLDKAHPKHGEQWELKWRATPPALSSFDGRQGASSTSPRGFA